MRADDRVTVNGERLWRSLMELAEIGAYHDERTGLRGVNRLALTDADAAGRRLVIGWMEQAGLAVRVDRAARGRRAVRRPDRHPPARHGRLRRVRGAARHRRAPGRPPGSDQHRPGPRGADRRPAQPRRRADGPRRGGPRGLPAHAGGGAARSERRHSPDGPDLPRPVRRRRARGHRPGRRRPRPGPPLPAVRRGPRRPGDRRPLPHRHDLRTGRVRRHQPHPPREYSTPEACAHGIDVLATALLRLAGHG